MLECTRNKVVTKLTKANKMRQKRYDKRKEELSFIHKQNGGLLL